MRYYLALCILSNLFTFPSIHCTQKLQDIKLSVGVIIPCHPKHAPYLYDLIRAYENQTVQPNELVISLSESNQVAPDIIDAIKNEPWIFPVILVQSDAKLFAGQNRNQACKQATANILMCQDADDLPHPQRVEIAKYLFEKYDLDFLMHQFIVLDEGEIPHYDYYEELSQIKIIKPRSFHHIYGIGMITNGNIIISRRVFDTIKWSNRKQGQDVYFTGTALNTFKRRYVVLVPLLLYRNFLSSHAPG